MTDLAQAGLGHIPVSSALAATLARASEGARATGAADVALEHVLAALCDDEDAIDVLAASNIDAGRLKSEVIAHLAGQDGGAHRASVRNVGASAALLRILEAAAAAARGGRRRDINGAIVLAAIVGDGRSAAAQILQSHGLTFDGAIRALQAALGQPARQSAPAIAPAEDVLARARERVQSRSAPSLRDIMRDKPHLSPRPQQDATGGMTDFVPAHGPVVAAPVVISPPAAASDMAGSVSPPAPTASPPPDAEAETRAKSAETADMAVIPVQPGAPQSSPSVAAEARADAASPPEQVTPAPDLTQPALPADGPRGEAPSLPSALSPSGYAPAREHGQPIPTASSGTGVPGAAGAPPPPPPLAASPPAPSAPYAMPPPPPAGNATGVPPPPFSPQPQSAPPAWPAVAPLPPVLERASIGPRPPPIPPRVPPPGAAPTGPRAAGGRSMPAPTPGAPPPAPVSTPPSARLPQHKAELGQLVENVPRVMRVGVSERVEVRLAHAHIKGLTEGLEGGGLAWRHDVTITKAMSVRLRAPEGGFFIETASPETQWIDSQFADVGDEYASWRFMVTPQRSGRARLQIIVSARTVGADGLAAETAFPDQLIDLKVRANYVRFGKRVVGWTLAAVAGGAFATFGEGAMSAATEVIRSLMAS